MESDGLGDSLGKVAGTQTSVTRADKCRGFQSLVSQIRAVLF